MNSVTAYCIIRGNRLIVNGEIVFESPGASLDTFLEAAYRALNPQYPKFFKMDRLSKLGFLGAEQLLSGAKEKYSPPAIAVVLSNANSSLDTDLRYLESTKTIASPSLFVYTLPNIVAGEICIRHGLKGENAFFVTPRFDPDWITGYVDLVLSHRKTEACLAGWIDVMHNEGEVFLYLAGKTNAKSMDHTSGNILKLYQAWTH